MLAIIETGGKQYKVTEGKLYKFETLTGEVGASVEFDKVLLVKDDKNVNIGTPYVENAKVSGEIVTHGRAPKIHIIKFRRRKHYMRQMGHRQDFTQVKITKIGK